MIKILSKMREALRPPSVLINDDDASTPWPSWRNRGAPQVAALRKNGKLAYYKEYPGVGHNVWEYVYTDAQMCDWLFSQRRQPRQE